MLIFSYSHILIFSGGYMPLAATLATTETFDAFLGKKKWHALLHGHSFTVRPYNDFLNFYCILIALLLHYSSPLVKITVIIIFVMIINITIIIIPIIITILKTDFYYYCKHFFRLILSPVLQPWRAQDF